MSLYSNELLLGGQFYQGNLRDIIIIIIGTEGLDFTYHILRWSNGNK